MTSSQRVVIGKFGRAHGTRGELRLWCYHRESPLLERARLKGWARDESGQLTAVTITSIQLADRFAIVSLQGVRHRDQAEAWVNQELLVDRAQFEALEEDELYLIDTIGWPVFVAKTPAALYEVGVVQGYLDSGAYEMMRVEVRDGTSWLVPMLDHCIEELTPERARVVLAPLELWAPPDAVIPEGAAPVEPSVDEEQQE